MTDTSKTGQALTNDTLTIDKPLIVETSLKISRALVGFLRRLNVAARIERGRTGANNKRRLARNGLTPACFESVARHEITIGGRKIVAGAQRIFGTRYFQHGSIKIAGIAPHPALIRVKRGMSLTANLSKSGNKSAPGSCYSLQKIAPCPHSMALAFKAAFEEVFRSALPGISLTEADRGVINVEQARLDCIMGLPGAAKGASLPSGFGVADLSPLGDVRSGLEAGFLTQSTLTEMRRVCGREVNSRSERAMQITQNQTPGVGGTVRFAVKS